MSSKVPAAAWWIGGLSAAALVTLYALRDRTITTTSTGKPVDTSTPPLPVIPPPTPQRKRRQDRPILSKDGSILVVGDENADKLATELATVPSLDSVSIASVSGEAQRLSTFDHKLVADAEVIVVVLGTYDTYAGVDFDHIIGLLANLVDHAGANDPSIILVAPLTRKGPSYRKVLDTEILAVATVHPTGSVALFNPAESGFFSSTFEDGKYRLTDAGYKALAKELAAYLTAASSQSPILTDPSLPLPSPTHFSQKLRT